jgi:hypothetical protein
MEKNNNNAKITSVRNYIYIYNAKALVPILRTLQGRSGHYIKNSRQLKEIVKGWSIQRDEILVSYDVEKLYPSIPISKALELIECLLKCKGNLQETTTFSISSIMKLLKWIFSLTYCEYNGNHYVLDCGPIGLSVVGEVAIIYMEDFQMRARSSSYPELKEWPWYVDDSVLKCIRRRAAEILEYLNSIEPGVIKFTKEEEENGKLPSLDLELITNRTQKKIEFNVHYKKTNTNITIKKKSNHRDSTKRGVIKGYADRARSLCDTAYLENEMKNIQDVFQDNGYTKEEIIDAMTETQRTDREEETEDVATRGIVVMPNVPGFTQQFNKIARKHNFRVANKADNKVRDLISSAKTPLGDKNTNVVYNIPCRCEKFTYVGETDRKWATRKKEHQDKVRLTKNDMQNGNIERATTRMNDRDGGLAKHATSCEQEIMWEQSRIIGREENWTQRKLLEGIETLRQKNKGKTPLNQYNQMDQWKGVLHELFKNDVKSSDVT